METYMKKNKNKNEGYFSLLKGFRRAVPIILAAVALFIAVCFITDSAGALGAGVGSLLLGLFSYGAYTIPLLLVLHAIFYAEDHAKKMLTSRIIFSVIAVVFIATFEYTIAFWGEEPTFAPGARYLAQNAGGALGSIIAFGLIKLLGSVGVIILGVALLAIYATFFFASKDSAFGKVVISVLSAVASFLARVESGIKNLFKSSAKSKEEKAKKAREEKQKELLDDQFFSAGTSGEVSVKELGIHERGTSEGVILNLKDSVSDEKPDNIDRATQQTTSAKPLSERRSVNLNYEIPQDTPAEPVQMPKAEAKTQSYGIDEAADAVFTREFNPFDFEKAEKLVSKAKVRGGGYQRSTYTEYGHPVNTAKTPEELERQRRIEAFELKKQQLRRMREAEETKTEEMSYGEPPKDIPKTVEVRLENEPRRMNDAPVGGAEFKATLEKRAEPDADARAAETIAERVAMTNAAYARSANESIHTRIIYQEEAPVAEAEKEVSAIEPEITEERESAPITVEESEKPQFSDFEGYADRSDAQPITAEETIRLERTPLSSTPTPIEKAIDERDRRYTVIDDSVQSEVQEAESSETLDFIGAEATATAPETGDEATFFNFGEDSSEDSEDTPEDNFQELDLSIPDEESDEGDVGEIPPEEQNPEVIKQRCMFPFLDSDEEDADEEIKDEQIADEEAYFETDEEIPEEYEDDEPPFELDESVKEVAATALVSTEELKKEKDKEKKEKKKKEYENFTFPPIELLGKDENVQDDNVSVEIQENADKLIETLASFNVTASIKGVDRGPRITRYEVVPAKGVKVSNVMNLQDNIALELAANEIRMEAPIPGKSAIGIEIPNKKATTVRLRDLLETPDFLSFKSKTSVCIGRDVAGQPVFGDLATMPHLLIAGATGMGKSVCINALMISILYKARPNEVKFIMIDPKQVEFTMYNGIPHLLVPVVSDAKQAAGVLMWAVEEMEKRYAQLNTLYVRNVDAYNEKIANDPSLGEPLSKIVIVIDEFADLMLQVRDPVENLVMRIAQKARAAGIHLIIGTQRPTANVITGTIKANIPSRISCKVASNVDSRTVLDASGAEKLLNRGDMLYAFAGAIKPLRVQGAFVSDGEVEAIMKHLQSTTSGDHYDSTVMEEIERAAQKCSKKSDSGRDADDDSSGEGYLNDQQFLDAVELAVNTGRIATSLIQRKLSIGYGKAAKFIDIMEDMGIVGEQNGQRPREVKITPDEWREKLARASLD